ncbi:MAG TPA: hypothetical protein VFE51_14140 [Verrucomicrobiae bacterium]|nr:hypothetical protein [Verrucomicrobiae bacterium]
MDAKSISPKIVSVIFTPIASLFIVWLFVPSFWFWTGFEFIAAALVVIGCGGEWYLHHHPAGKKKTERDEHHKLESRFIASVVAGVFMELFALGHTIREGVNLEGKVAKANEQVAVLTNETFRLSLSLEDAKSNNLVLRSNVVALEVRSRWREITQEQKRNFINSTRNVGKFGIRIRFATRGAEVLSFAHMIRDMLDSAGFAETNAEPIAEWPPGMNVLYRGGAEGWQMPSVMFLNNVVITNAPVGPNAGIDKVFYVLATNSTVYADEFWAIIAQTNNFQMSLGDGDVGIIVEKTNYVVTVPAHSVRPILLISDPNVRKIWDFLKVRAVFYSMGITTEWMTNTNLSVGTCEIFVNPKL